MRPVVFGFRPAETGSEEAVQTVLTPPDRCSLLVTPNLDHVVRLRRDPDFRRAYDRAALVLCDGAPVQVYATLRGNRLRRVTGCDLLAGLLRAEADARVPPRWFFVVDAPQTERAVRGWADACAGARVEVAVPPMGFVDDQAYCTELARRIASHGTTLLVMGVGAPGSEIFVDRSHDLLPPCWAVCVGQAVKVSFGLVRRAPGPLRALHLEWFWRVCQEPRRLGRRYAFGAFGFLLAVAGDLRQAGRERASP